MPEEISYERKLVDGIEVIFSADWINDLEREIHFGWYWQQANIVYTRCNRAQSILEIGVGTSLLADLLKRRGWRLKTLDIDGRKNPDFCSSAVDFDYGAHKIEVVLAFEIFEHIPFSTFEKVVSKLSECNVRNVYFSLPQCEREILNISFKLPRLKRVAMTYALPRGEITTLAHFWELGYKDKSLGNKQLISIPTLRNLFDKHGYSIQLLNKSGYIQYFAAVKAS
jgi:hypothetical protein